jgi:hypothetical protein
MGGMIRDVLIFEEVDTWCIFTFDIHKFTGELDGGSGKGRFWGVVNSSYIIIVHLYSIPLIAIIIIQAIELFIIYSKIFICHIGR